MKIPIFSTYINPDSIHKINKILSSTFLSEGKLVEEFEKKLSANLGMKNPVTVNSGTSALHLALVLAGVKEGDEVILPAQTFIATGSVILQQKATPIFADIDYSTGNILVEDIKNKLSSKTKAIVVVHWGGYPCDMDEIMDLAKKYNIPVIEDAAHALGAKYKKRSIGEISDYTCFSFQAIKHLTTGDGGAVACRNIDNYKEARIKRWFGIDRKNSEPSLLGERKFDIDELGYKYHLNDFSAGLGIMNLKGFKNRLNKRLEIANFYQESLSSLDGISLFNYKQDRQSAFWLFGFHVEKREQFILALKSKGITTSVIHQGIDRFSIFNNTEKELMNQRRFDKTQIHIPIHDSLSFEQAEFIIEQIKIGWV